MNTRRPPAETCFQLLGAVLILFILVLPSTSLAVDVYVDTETKQLFIEPGPGRKRIGTLVLDNPADIDMPEEPLADGHTVIADKDNTNSEAFNESDELKANISLGEDGAFRFGSNNGHFNFRLGGRIHADATFSSGDDFVDAGGNGIEANNGTEIRRGRLKFEGTFFRDWFFKTEVDFADNEVSVKDMFIQYHGTEFARIRVGEQKQAFSRELQESSNDLLFLERSVMNVLNGPTVDRALGLNISASGTAIFGLGQNWTSQIGIYGDTIDANKRNTFADEGWAINSRMTFAPIAEADRVIHIGIAGNFREPNDAGEIIDTPLSLAYETTHMSNLNLIRTDISGVDNIVMLGVEGHGLLGPFSVGGEYTHSWTNLQGTPDLSFQGWYTEAAWTLTKEPRVYTDGLFYRVIPNSAFSLNNGGWGAWEIAARYGEVDLNDGMYKGGKLGNLTVGLNWYPNRIVRFMASYDHVLTIRNSPLTRRDGSRADNLDTFMFRAQMAF
ncbi:OprO/OprP family phosphate-selective porin [Nitrosomonas marina]|nr:porin [Nitrosomonas marina]